MRRALAAAIALAAVVLLVPAAARAYYLPNADVVVRVAPDGSLLVAEHITITGAYHGAYRDIPLRKGESIDRISISEGATRYARGGSTKLGSIDRSDTFNYETNGKRVRIVWHFLAGGEPRTFTVAYRFRGLTVAYDDVADVNLKVWGPNWSSSLGNLTALVTLPRATPLGPRYRVYGHPAWVNGVVARTPRVATLRAVNVPGHQWVEMRVVFPRGLLRSTAGAKTVPGNGLATIVASEASAQAAYRHDREHLDDARNHPGRTLLYLVLLGVGPALLVLLLVWLLYGRERETGYDREYEQEPPTDTEPALVPPLLRESTDVGSPEFTATLFDLIRSGGYTSTPVTTERKTWGGMKHETVSDLLVTPGDAKVALTDFEQPVAEVIDSVVDADGERLSEFREKIEAHRSSNATRFTSFKSNVSSAIDKRKWYTDAGGGAIGLLLFACIVAAIVLLWIGIAGWRPGTPRWGDVVLVALGGCAIANAVLLVFAFSRVRLWRRRTRPARPRPSGGTHFAAT